MSLDEPSLAPALTPTVVPTGLPAPAVDWRTISALNATSTFAQMGQFGVGFVVLPLWLAQQGKGASFVGVFSSAQWLGMVLGFLITPSLLNRVSARRLVALGLGLTMLAMVSIALSPSPVWPVAAALSGLGMGLRWLALEPWLYAIAPAQGRGRMVGFHETLIAIAPIACPALALVTGLQGHALFVLGAGFCALALVPLAFARPQMGPVQEANHGLTEHPDKPAANGTAMRPSLRASMGMSMRVGLVVAVFGGLMEGSVASLFGLFGAGRGLDAEALAASLTLFGIGGLLVQFAIGWLSDHRGLRFSCLVCGAVTLVTAIGMAFPLGVVQLGVAVLVLGAALTCYLTLATIASTVEASADMARNVARTSLVYTVSAGAGPLIAAVLMEGTGSDALVWLVAVLAAGFIASTIVAARPVAATLR